MVKVRKFGMRDKMGYMFGDFGNDFFFMLVASFLMVFYTDVFHISPAAVGTLFLIARLWDPVVDVTWGRFIDTRNPGKHVKFKPWIFRMSFPLVFFWYHFVTNTLSGETLKIMVILNFNRFLQSTYL